MMFLTVLAITLLITSAAAAALYVTLRTRTACLTTVNLLDKREFPPTPPHVSH